MSKFSIPLLRGMAREAAKDGQTAINKAKAELKKAEKSVSLLESLDKDLEAVPESDVDVAVIRVKDAIKSLYAGLIRTFVSLSHFVSVPFSFGRILDKEDYLPAHLELEEQIEGIKAYAEEDCIMIRTPLLPNIRNMTFCMTSSYGQKFVMSSTKAYCKEVGRALDYSEDMKTVQRDRYLKKTIQYLFIFNDDRNEVDNDNRDTTQMTNTICERLYGGDAPTRCRIILDSVKTDAIPEGTYIAVLPFEKPILQAETVIEFWSKNGQQRG